MSLTRGTVYIDQGKVAFYFMNLSFIGPDSYTAALAAQSVYHQDNELFWTYLDTIFKNQGDEQEEWATADFLVNVAKQENLSIDYDLLKKDIEEMTYKSEVDAHNAKADELKLGEHQHYSSMVKNIPARTMEITMP